MTFAVLVASSGCGGGGATSLGDGGPTAGDDAGTMGDDGPGGTPTTTDWGPPASYTEARSVLVLYRCEGCHVGGPTDPFPNLSLDPIGAMRDVDSMQCTPARKLIAPGSPETSYLMHKLLGTDLCMGERMPGTMVMLKEDELKIIGSWIAGGAIVE